MKQVELLLDKASKMCGSDKALAQRLNITPPDVCQMRSGKRTITPETAAELADIARVDPFQALADAVIERNVGTRREDVLREILGKGLHAIAAATLVFSYSGPWNDAMAATRSKTAPHPGNTHSIHRMKSRRARCRASTYPSTCLSGGSQQRHHRRTETWRQSHQPARRLPNANAPA